MSSYERDFDERPVRSLLKWGLAAILIVGLLGIAWSFMGVFGKAVTAPGRVISKTLETDNIIQSYEWFYDVNAGYEARTSQIGEFVGLQSEATDSGDKAKLRTELSAIRATCRKLATQYNANSEKMNKQVFKGWSLPDRLPMSECEVTS